jgi:beta-N-acetylhexosaminidase
VPLRKNAAIFRIAGAGAIALALAGAIAAALCSCGNRPPPETPVSELPPPADTAALEQDPAAESARAAAEQRAREAALEAQRVSRAREIAAQMDDSALAAQVIIAGVDGNGVLGAGMARLLKEHPPGALMLFSYNLKADKKTVRAFLAECSSAAAEHSIAPFIAVDHEGGDVSRFSSDVKKLPPAASYHWRTLAVDETQTLWELQHHAFQSAQEIRALGVTMNFAPVAEILTAENAAFLGGRSYGNDPVFVEKACAAFIAGMEKAGVACVVKHFPGNAAVDPHEARPIIDADSAALAAMTAPFAALIRGSHPPAIMVSHAVISAKDPERNGSLSPLVIGWLRDMGFSGIAIADDFSMGAVAASGIRETDAVVAALNAGIDMVMAWPPSLAATHRAIHAALKNGSLHRARLEEAASRIILKKLCFGLVE